MSEYVHHYSKIQVNNVAKVRDWLQAGSAPKSSLPLQTSKEVTSEAERMKTLSLNEARGGDLNSKAEDAISTRKQDSLNELCSMFPKLNPHQLYQVLVKNQFDLQKAIESLLDIPQSSTKSRSRNIAKTGSSVPENRAATHTGNVVSGTSRTEPIHQLRTDITANSRTRRSSQTVSGAKSSVVSSNVTRTTPHSFDTCSCRAVQRSRQGSLLPPVSPVSPSRSNPAMPPYPECAVCFRSLAGCRMNQDMYQCVQGHLLCADCKERVFFTEFRDICKNLMTEYSSRSPTISETKSSVVSSNVTRTTPNTFDTRSMQTGQKSRQVSRSLPVSPVSPVSQSAAPPAIPPCPECPVCFSSLAGSRIIHCAQGHSLCGDCSKNPQVKNCPTCRGKLVGRATNMEQLLASIYSGE